MKPSVDRRTETEMCTSFLIRAICSTCVLFAIHASGFQSPTMTTSTTKRCVFPTNSFLTQRTSCSITNASRRQSGRLQMAETPTEEKQQGGGGIFSDEIQQEAKDALEPVGRASPAQFKLEYFYHLTIPRSV